MKMVYILVLGLFLGGIAGEYHGYIVGVDDVALPAYELGYADAILSCSEDEGDVNE